MILVDSVNFFLQGMIGLRGNVIAFQQSIDELASSLPRLPRDLPFLILQSSRKDGKKMDLKIRPQVVLECLTYLKQNCPPYKDIPISEANMDFYRQNDGKVEGIPTIYLDEEKDSVREAIEDCQTIDGEQVILTEQDLLQNDFPAPESFVPNVVPTETIKVLVKEAIMKAGMKATNEQQETFAFPKRLDQPLSESDEFYYSKTFPHLFCNGQAEFRQRGRPATNYTFHSWLTHLKNYHDGRFREDPTFLMVASNQLRRKEQLKIGHLMANDEEIKDLTMAQLQQKIQTDDSILDKLRYHFQSVKGSTQFFYIERKKARALNRHLIARSGGEQQMTLFLTLSPSDFHLDAFHRLLPESKEYIDKKVVASVNDIPDDDKDNYITKSQDYTLRAQALNRHTDLFTNFFLVRAKQFIDVVLKEALGVENYFYRVEHQSRGAPHLHLMLQLKNSPSVKQMDLAFKHEVTKLLQESAVEHLRQLTNMRHRLEDLDNMTEAEKTNFEYLKAKHDELLGILDAKRIISDYVTEHLGISATHPNMDCNNWPKPWGTNYTEPKINVLRQDLSEILSCQDTMLQSYSRLVDRVQLHRHTLSYCLREKKKAEEEKDGKAKEEGAPAAKSKPEKNNKDNKSEAEVSAKKDNHGVQQEVVVDGKTYECRFGFDKPFFGYEPIWVTSASEKTQVLTQVTRQHHLNEDGTQAAGVIHPRGALITPNVPRNEKLMLLRNHSQFNETIKEIALIWLANTGKDINEIEAIDDVTDSNDLNSFFLQMQS